MNWINYVRRGSAITKINEGTYMASKDQNASDLTSNALNEFNTARNYVKLMLGSAVTRIKDKIKDSSSNNDSEKPNHHHQLYT